MFSLRHSRITVGSLTPAFSASSLMEQLTTQSGSFSISLANCDSAGCSFGSSAFSWSMMSLRPRNGMALLVLSFMASSTADAWRGVAWLPAGSIQLVAGEPRGRLPVPIDMEPCSTACSHSVIASAPFTAFS